MTRAKLVGRVLAAVLVLGSVATLGVGALGASETSGVAAADADESVAPARDNVTVIATDSASWLGQGATGPRSKAELVAVGPDGRIIYENDTYTRYWDVDPVPNTSHTVQYVAAMHLTPEECGSKHACTRNIVERVNLTTGEVERVFSRITAGKHSTRWHDVDRITENRLLVADIAQDRVFIVNTSSDIVTWAWSVQSVYAPADSGGPFPEDWTHLNDVEYLGAGPGPEYMASVRNHDQVVFLDHETGLVSNMTLGTDGNHSRLYEQHNPDYIPATQGGPAVLVADSENNRVVEYQRVDGEWVRSWTWSDGRLQWPRDADRLPNGNTLVTDSNGNRVVEVNGDGEIVWSIEVAFPYEAERLGTGDESTTGPSAEHAGLASHTSEDVLTGGGDAGTIDRLQLRVENALRGPTVNAVFYVLPIWMGVVELGALVVLVLTVVGWTAAELYWSTWQLDVAWPVRLTRGGEGQP